MTLAKLGVCAEPLLSAVGEVLMAAHAAGEAHLEGTTLVARLQDIDADMVSTAKQALGGKGWLRNVVGAMMGQVCEVEVPGRGEPCYRLAGVEVEEVPPPSLDPAAAAALVAAALPHLARAEDCVLPGSRLAEALEAELPEEVAAARAAHRGRAWLARVLDAELTVCLVHPAGRTAEPHFKLVLEEDAEGARPKRRRVDGDQSPEATLAKLGDLAQPLMQAIEQLLRDAHRQGLPYVEGNKLVHAMLPERADVVSGAKALLGGKGWFKAVVAASGGAFEEVAVRGLGEPCFRLVWGADTVDRRHRKVLPPLDASSVLSLTASALALLAAADDCTMPAALLSQALEAEQPEEVSKVRGAAGGPDWLRRVLAGEPAVRVAFTAEGPAYRLASAIEATGSGAAARVVAAAPPAAPRKPPRRRPASGGALADPALPPGEPMGLQGLLRDAAVKVLGDCGEEFMEGARLVDRLQQEQDPATVAQVKASLKGKGWLCSLLEPDPRVLVVKVPGRGEPCYRLASWGPLPVDIATNGAPTQRQLAAAAAPVVADQLIHEAPKWRLRPQSAEEVQHIVGAADLQAILSMATRFLAGLKYLEGGRLVAMMSDVDPTLVRRAKESLGGKGWLKVILESDPRIERVELPGLRETCWRLVG